MECQRRVFITAQSSDRKGPVDFIPRMALKEAGKSAAKDVTKDCTECLVWKKIRSLKRRSSEPLYKGTNFQ